jgi:hypothetical protein
MELKIILGIVVPLSIMIIIGIFGGLNFGTTNSIFVKDISVQNLFQGNNLKDRIKIGELQIDNKHIISKRYDLDILGACLRDNDGVKQMVDAGLVEYSEGDIIPNNPYSTSNYLDKSVLVNANSKKTLGILLRPAYSYNSKTQDVLLREYKDYDELIIYEKKYTNSRSVYGSLSLTFSCYSLDSETVNNAKHIPLVV